MIPMKPEDVPALPAAWPASTLDLNGCQGIIWNDAYYKSIANAWPEGATLTAANTVTMANYSIGTIDPVCGIEVDENAPFRYMHGDHIYGFCSGDCRDEFLANLEEYLDDEDEVDTCRVPEPPDPVIASGIIDAYGNQRKEYPVDPRIVRYLRHDMRCPIGAPCDCGLDNLKAELGIK